MPGIVANNLGRLQPIGPLCDTQVIAVWNPLLGCQVGSTWVSSPRPPVPDSERSPNREVPMSSTATRTARESQARLSYARVLVLLDAIEKAGEDLLGHGQALERMDPFYGPEMLDDLRHILY